MAVVSQLLRKLTCAHVGDAVLRLKGKCQSTGKIGMFPGVFATRIAHGQVYPHFCLKRRMVAYHLSIYTDLLICTPPYE